MLATATPPPSAVDARIRDQALRVVVEERITELLLYRRWWRANRWADWPQIRGDLDTELRALVRLARRARHITRVPALVDPGDHFQYPVDVIDPRDGGRNER